MGGEPGVSAADKNGIQFSLLLHPRRDALGL